MMKNNQKMELKSLKFVKYVKMNLKIQSLLYVNTFFVKNVSQKNIKKTKNAFNVNKI